MKTRFLVALLLCLSFPAWAKVKLPRLVSDNMVLQREQPVPVWGWADPDETVTVAFASQKVTAIAGADGKWMARLAPLTASGEPADLIVTGTNTQTVHKVLVGEVWLCGGQSNMGLHLKDCFNGPEEVAAANYPQIRFFPCAGGNVLLPVDDIARGAWLVCTPEVTANFAGVAYFFGRKLHTTLNVPVGLIEFDRGATGIECWVPLEAYRTATEPEMQQIYREVVSWNPNTEIGQQAFAAAFQKLRDWLPVAKRALDEHQVVPAEPLLPTPSPYQANACETYNGTIHPLTPYAIRGATWYQGESNPGEGKIYSQKMMSMIRGWRQAWGSDFPFFFVQLANEGNPNHDPAADGTERYVPVREAQRRALRLPNTGMVVAIDLGEDANGHPRNKKEVGERLATWAFAKTYGKDVPCSGPLYRDCRIEGDRVILNFDYTGSGLMVADKDGLNPVREIKDGALTQFAICGTDGRWYWGDARIVGETVVVRSDKVPAPVKIRYAYSMNPKGPKLYNREGLPASPFGTDDW